MESSEKCDYAIKLFCKSNSMRAYTVLVLISLSLTMSANIGDVVSSFTIDGKARIQSSFLSYGGSVGLDFVPIETTYAGDMTAEVSVKGENTISILLKNVSYTNPLYSKQDRHIGNILFDNVQIDSDGSFNTEESLVTLSEGNTVEVESWDCSHADPPYPARVSGTVTNDHKLNAVIEFWLWDRSFYASGEFFLRILFGETLSPFEYRRSVVAGELGTIVLPFKPSKTEGIEKIYRVVGKQKDSNDSAYDLVLQEVETIEAGTPYVFKSNRSEIVLSAPGDAERAWVPSNLRYIYTSYSDLQEGFSVLYKKEGLQGLFMNTAVKSIGHWDTYIDEWIESSYDYFVNYNVNVIKGNGYVKGNKEDTVNAYNAFVLMEYVPEFTGFLDEHHLLVGMNTTTNVNFVNQKNNIKQSIYNLAGQKILNIQNGINIINGKKVIKK